MSEKILEEIAASLANLQDSDGMAQLLHEALSQGIPVADIVEKGLRAGLQNVGEKYAACEYFLSELLYAASIMDEAFTMLRPALEGHLIQNRGIIVLGTVRGDIHDIGKNIFKMMAEASGFRVHDLGVDVEPERYVERLKETDADILGLSALLTTVTPEIKVVMERLGKSNLRGNVRVILGGNAVTEDLARQTGADKAALDAIEGVSVCTEWMRR